MLALNSYTYSTREWSRSRNVNVITHFKYIKHQSHCSIATRSYLVFYDCDRHIFTGHINLHIRKKNMEKVSLTWLTSCRPSTLLFCFRVRTVTPLWYHQRIPQTYTSYTYFYTYSLKLWVFLRLYQRYHSVRKQIVPRHSVLIGRQSHEAR